MHCTELQIGFYISDQSLYGIFGFIFGLVCPVYTYTCRKLLALMPETFHFCYMRKLLTVWMVAFYDHVVLLCIGMSDHFWSLCISMCRLYTYKYKICVCGALFSISKTTVYLNCSALQTHFVSCYILQRRFNVGFCSHSPFPDIYIFQCTRTVSYVPIHTYVVFHVLVNQQIKSRLCFLFVYSFASLSC